MTFADIPVNSRFTMRESFLTDGSTVWVKVSAESSEPGYGLYHFDDIPRVGAPYLIRDDVTVYPVLDSMGV